MKDQDARPLSRCFGNRFMQPVIAYLIQRDPLGF
jgi:hypothetical protein